MIKNNKAIIVIILIILLIVSFVSLWNLVDEGYDKQNKLILGLKKIIPRSLAVKIRDTLFIIPELKHENNLLQLQVDKYEQGLEGKIFTEKKIVKGFTTNPSLMRKAGAKDYKSYSQKILKICKNKPVSLEVFADEYSEMKKQALKINTWAKNVYVKIPVVNSKGKFLGKVI